MYTICKYNLNEGSWCSKCNVKSLTKLTLNIIDRLLVRATTANLWMCTQFHPHYVASGRLKIDVLRSSSMY